jgi:hypothetical protein
VRAGKVLEREPAGAFVTIIDQLLQGSHD